MNTRLSPLSAQQIESLSPGQRDFVVQELRRRANARKGVDGTASISSIIPAISRDQDPPLSFAQERLWFLDHWHPGSIDYLMPAAIELLGEVDLMALRRAINEVVRRHEILRTTFIAKAGRPVQIIQPAATVEFPVIDLEGLTKEEQPRALRLLGTLESTQPFDLTRGPLIRIRWLRMAPLRHILFYVMHHIIADDWSIRVIIRETRSLYASFSSGMLSELSDCPIQYADFAAWQRERLQGDLLNGQLNYWREKLEGHPSSLNLPTDWPRPKVATGRGALHKISVSRDVTEGLRTLGLRLDATLFMTVLAGFKILLQKFSGQEDILVGTSVSNRNRKELENVVGLFINTLVVRTDLSGDPAFPDLLARVRENALGAWAHADFPFDQLVNALQPKRDPGCQPLFQVMFELQSFSAQERLRGGADTTSMEIETVTAKFDLLVTLTDSANGLIGGIEYNTDLFKESTMEEFALLFVRLLAEINTSQARRVSEFLTDGQRNRRQSLAEEAVLNL